MFLSAWPRNGKADLIPIPFSYWAVPPKVTKSHLSCCKSCISDIVNWIEEISHQPLLMVMMSTRRKKNEYNWIFTLEIRPSYNAIPMWYPHSDLPHLLLSTKVQDPCIKEVSISKAILRSKKKNPNARPRHRDQWCNMSVSLTNWKESRWNYGGIVYQRVSTERFRPNCTLS